MDARDAISAAKANVKNVFADEDIINIGLEELSFDEDANRWRVTIGFFTAVGIEPAGPGSGQGRNIVPRSLPPKRPPTGGLG